MLIFYGADVHAVDKTGRIFNITSSSIRHADIPYLPCGFHSRFWIGQSCMFAAAASGDVALVRCVDVICR